MKVTEIKNCPGTLAAVYDTYSPTALKRMFDGKRVSHMLDFANDAASRELIDDNIHRISISGVQEKLSAIVDHGHVRLAPEGVQGRYIIKPAPDDKRIRHRDQMPANEHLTMQIARQVYGIPTAENALIFFSDGEPAYITRRFDIASDGAKIKQEDFASLWERTGASHGKNFKYTGDYAGMGALLPKYVAAWQVEAARFFRLVVFNYLFANGDAHLKNFSLTQSVGGDYLLTPAYDLLNSSLHIDDGDFALEGGLFDREHYSETYRQKGHPCQDDFVTLGHLIGVPEIPLREAIQVFTTSQPLVYELTERSFLDKRLKRMYIASYEERLGRLNRKDQ
jgi:serine/threonine-protein kinase HipA